MEPDDLLCSRNARPPKALVGRAQWEINQVPPLKKSRASLEGAFISLDARSESRHGSSLIERGGKEPWSEKARSTAAVRPDTGTGPEEAKRASLEGTVIPLDARSEELAPPAAWLRGMPVPVFRPAVGQ